MITSFLQYYDRITNFSAKGYETPEVLLFLNNAQDEFIKERLFGTNFQPPAFDDNEKRVADIRPLLVLDGMSTTVSSNYVNSVFVNPYLENNNVRYVLSIDIRVTRTDPVLTNVYLRANKISVEDVGKFMSSEFNQTWFKNPVYFNSGDGYIYLIGDNYTTVMDHVRLTIVRNPSTITETTFEFNGIINPLYMSLEPSVHQEIVDMAVTAARGAGREQKSQIDIIEERARTK